jgi:hypothetical protein
VPRLLAHHARRAVAEVPAQVAPFDLAEVDRDAGVDQPVALRLAQNAEAAERRGPDP